MELVAIIIALIVPIGVSKIACENVRHNVSDHFPDVRKTIAMPKSAEKEIDDCLLTRYACHLVAEGNELNAKIEAIIKELGE